LQRELPQLLWTHDLVPGEGGGDSDGSSRYELLGSHDQTLATHLHRLALFCKRKVQHHVVTDAWSVLAIEKRAKHVYIAQQGGLLFEAEVREDGYGLNRKVNPRTSTLLWERAEHEIQSSLALFKIHVSSGDYKRRTGKVASCWPTAKPLI
jgi:hypothetical protein